MSRSGCEGGAKLLLALTHILTWLPQRTAGEEAFMGLIPKTGFGLGNHWSWLLVNPIKGMWCSPYNSGQSTHCCMQSEVNLFRDGPSFTIRGRNHQIFVGHWLAFDDKASSIQHQFLFSLLPIDIPHQWGKHLLSRPFTFWLASDNTCHSYNSNHS